MPSLDSKRIICDPEDSAKISLINWTVDDDGRVRTTIKGKTVRLHQYVLPGHVMIDHKNGNQLDVRKDNLRPCDHITNGYNRKKSVFAPGKYKGVFFRKDMKKTPWRSYITVNKKQTVIGHYATEEEAARAYDRKAIESHGEFCNLNFPRSDYDGS